jgi:hypothetical protein
MKRIQQEDIPNAAMNTDGFWATNPSSISTKCPTQRALTRNLYFPRKPVAAAHASWHTTKNASQAWDTGHSHGFPGKIQAPGTSKQLLPVGGGGVGHVHVRTGPMRGRQPRVSWKSTSSWTSVAAISASYCWSEHTNMHTVRSRQIQAQIQMIS